jgi:hypothetical protein
MGQQSIVSRGKMMDQKLSTLLFEARPENTRDEEVWRMLINKLLDDFSEFLGASFVRDSQPLVDPSAPSFVQWIWSKPSSVLSSQWSAVVAGNLAHDRAGKIGLTINASVFIFSNTGNRRLFSKEGEAYVSFSFSRDSQLCGRWTCNGWQIDEFGEWNDLVFPTEQIEAGQLS